MHLAVPKKELEPFPPRISEKVPDTFFSGWRSFS